MFLLATGLILLGGLCALAGQKLFRLLLPIVGFVVGIMVGFGGVQGVFGTGVISLTIAILMAVIVGVIMAILSFVFFDIALIVLITVLGASLFSFLGVAIGLDDNGFVLFLLGLSGAILGFLFASAPMMSLEFVIAATSFLGVGLILGGVFIFAGNISIDQLQDEGIIPAVVEVVDQSFLWAFVWLAGSIVAVNAQSAVVKREFLDFADSFEYVESKKR